MQDVPMISRDILFGDPEHTQVRLSPDGQYVSYLAPHNGVLNIWVRAIDGAYFHPITADKGRGICAHNWAYDNTHILYVQDKDGDENWNVFKVDVKTGRAANITKKEGVHVQILKGSYKKPEHIIISMNNRDPRFHDPYLLNITSGEMKKLFDNNRYSNIIFDDDLMPRLGKRYADNGDVVYDKKEGNEWVPFVIAPLESEDAMVVAPLNVMDKKSYWIDSRQGDTGALVEINMKTGMRKELACHPNADIETVCSLPKTGVPFAAQYNYSKTGWIFLNEEFASDIKHIATQESNAHIELVSWTLAYDKWVVALHGDQHSAHYYLYDRQTKDLTFLLAEKPVLDNAPLVPMHPILIKARDGLEMVGYLTLPKWADPDGKGRPKTLVPLVVMVHGGPWHRDSWGLNPYHQWMANRGYAVLSVNFRGSTGFGKRFVRISHGAWSQEMHHDILDSVKWAIENKITSQDQIAILGGSYGGYEVLVALTKNPKDFVCGIDIVGPSNLDTLIENIVPYWTSELAASSHRIWGASLDAPDKKERLHVRSPIHNVKEIMRPLMVAQGANDPRVKKSESDQIVHAMQEQGIPVTYLLYPDEGHGFVRPQNRISFWAAAEQFLAENLGGRFLPAGDDFKKSSVQLISGALEGLVRQQSS